MRPDDQPRSDLDAALDAVIPTLTAVDDDAAAASLRRTRIALADPRADDRGLPGWLWRVAGAVALTVILVAVAVWRRPAPAASEIAATAPPTAPVAETRPSAVVPGPGAAPAPPRVASSTPRPRGTSGPARRVRATSAPAAEPGRRPDPLAVLVAAVQAIPEDAWARGSAAPDVTIAPIAIAPLETPAIPDAPAEPIAPGEP